MTDHPTLFARPEPPPVPGISLVCGDIGETLREVRGASLVHADPPWTYQNSGTRGNASDQYALLPMRAIVGHLDAAYDAAAEDARLVVWTTWPHLGEYMLASQGSRWRLVTGGSWHKEGAPGVGHHWLGNSEPVLVYRKGSPYTDRRRVVTNAHSSRREAHSEKPASWLRSMLARWTRPGDLVLDMYAGLAPMARACSHTGRRYVGAEIDPARHALALGRLAASRYLESIDGA